MTSVVGAYLVVRTSSLNDKFSVCLKLSTYSIAEIAS